MLKICIVHGNFLWFVPEGYKNLQLCFVTFVSIYFVVPFLTMKTMDLVPLEVHPLHGTRDLNVRTCVDLIDLKAARVVVQYFTHVS